MSDFIDALEKELDTPRHLEFELGMCLSGLLLCIVDPDTIMELEEDLEETLDRFINIAINLIYEWYPKYEEYVKVFG